MSRIWWPTSSRAKRGGRARARLDMLRSAQKEKTPDERSGVSDQVSRNRVTARKKQRKPRIESGSLSSATGRTGPFVCAWSDAASAQLPGVRATVLDLLPLRSRVGL